MQEKLWVTVVEILFALTMLSYEDQEWYQYSSFLCFSRESKSD